MILNGLILFLQVVGIGFLIYEKVFVERFRFIFTSWFLIIYYITLVLVPFVMAVSLGGFRRVNTVLEGQYFDLETVYILGAYQIVILIGFYIIRFLKYRSPLRVRVFYQEELDFHFKVISLMPIIGIGLFLAAVGSNPYALMLAGRFSWFNDPNANIFLVAISQYFIAVVMLVCALFVVATKTRVNVLVCITCLLVVIGYSFLSLDRKFIIFFVSGIFGGLYLKNNQTLKFSKTTIFLSVILFAFMVISQMARDLLARYLTIADMSPAEYLSDFVDKAVFFIEYGDISYFYRASLESIAIVVEQGVLSPGALIIRNLLFFLPSSMSFGIKPPDISAIFSLYVNGEGGGRAGNMPPGLFGLYVTSFGVYLSAILLVSVPLFLRFLDNLVIQSRVWAFALSGTCLSSIIFFMRGDDSTAIYFSVAVSLCFLCSMLMYRLSWGGRFLFKKVS